MSDRVDVTSDAYRRLREAYQQVKSSTSGKVATKPKKSKAPGNIVRCLLIGKRQAGKNSFYRVLIVGNFGLSDVNAVAGEWVSPDQIDVFEFEKHLLSATELETLREANSIGGNQKYSNRQQIGRIELHQLEVIDVQAFTPWTLGDRSVEPGDYVRMDSLVRENTSKDGKTYSNWKCDNVSPFIPSPFEQIEIRGLIESARTRLVSLRYTPETEALPVPEELTSKLKEERNQYAIRDLENAMRWERMSPEQKAFVQASIAVPLNGIDDALAQKFGMLMTPMEFSISSKEVTTKTNEKQTYVDITGTVFATQIKGDNVERVQIGIVFSKDTISSIGILHAPNLVAFGKHLLTNARGCVWGNVDPVNSTNDTALATNENGELIADYPIWINTAWMHIDLIPAILMSAFEITADLAKVVCDHKKYKAHSAKYSATSALRFGDAVYNATESGQGIDSDVYRYFLMHPYYDNDRVAKLREIQEEREWSDDETIDRFCKFIGTMQPSELKPTDFKRLVDAQGKIIEDDHYATIFGIKKTAIDNAKSQPTGEQLLEIYEQVQKEYAATMSSFYDPQPKRAVEAEDSPAKRQKTDEAIVSD